VRVTASATGRRLAIPLQDGAFEYIDVLERVLYTIPRPGQSTLRFEIKTFANGSWRVEHNLPAGALDPNVPLGGSR